MKKLVLGLILSLVITSVAFAGVFTGLQQSAGTLGGGRMAVTGFYSQMNVPGKDAAGNNVFLSYPCAGGKVTFGLFDTIDVYLGFGTMLNKADTDNVNPYVAGLGTELNLIPETLSSIGVSLLLDANAWINDTKEGAFNTQITFLDYTLMAIASKHIANFDVYAGGGLHLMANSITSNKPGGSTYYSAESQTSFAGVLGGEFILTPNFSIGGEWNYAAMTAGDAYQTAGAYVNMAF